MPALVGGFGKMLKSVFNYINSIFFFKDFNINKKINILESLDNVNTKEKIKNLRKYGAYLAGLIEGDGTFAIKDENKIYKKNYNPHILVVFKFSDMKVAEFLCSLTRCGTVSKYKDRNYVL